MFFLRNLGPQQFPQIHPNEATTSTTAYLSFNSFLTGVFVNLTWGKKKIWYIWNATLETIVVVCVS